MFVMTLPTMTCGHCVKSVTAAVKTVDPQAEVHCDLPSHQVQVQTAADAAAVRAAAAAAGFEPV